MKSPFPYQYICVEGNIGSGKTSFCHLLDKYYNVELALEQFSDNPFLPHFYENPNRYALSVELFFMTERYKQLSEKLGEGRLFIRNIVADYFFDKTRLFARNNLHGMEFKLFQQIFESLSGHLSPPDVVLYIHRPVDQLREFILHRGRKMEQHISASYLQAIQDMYFDFFRMDMKFPVVIVNAENLDFTKSKDDFQKLASLLKQKYARGVHRVSFVR